MALSVLIAGGGTGGHLYPGIAVARALLARFPDAQVTFVGTAAGIESRVVPREGFTLDVIRSAGLKGKSLPSLLRGLALAAGQCARCLERALASASVGGDRRWRVQLGPGGRARGVARIPTLLMEQNAVPGLTNRLLASLVSAAAVTYEESLAVFGGKAFVAGNPVRPEFFREEAYGQHSSPPGAARVLVFGGSQGAHAINVAMVEAAPRLAAAAPRLAITHQTGERDLEMVRDGYRRAGLEARVEPFLFAMDREMKAADLVVCRAGATTLAELTAAGRPSILIPLPAATDDHQRKNAEALVDGGAARMVEQRELTGERLAREILALVAQRSDERRRMGAARRATGEAGRGERDRRQVLELAR